MKKGFWRKVAFVLKKTNILTVVLLTAMLIAAAPVLAWFSLRKNLNVYAPISAPESLYIGAGHRDIENETFEDIRYLYFDGIDATEDIEYWDHVFCVYGKAISYFKLQIAYTTNNQFTYEIYPASESQIETPGAIRYVTHTAIPETFFYSINGEALTGTFLNKTTVDGKDIGILDVGNTYYSETYDDYTAVNKYAVPIYWQTSTSQAGDRRTDFVRYYILRVCMNGKNANDRETDVICISAKSYSQ